MFTNSGENSLQIHFIWSVFSEPRHFLSCYTCTFSNLKTAGERISSFEDGHLATMLVHNVLFKGGTYCKEHCQLLVI